MDIKYLTRENFVGFNNYKVSGAICNRKSSAEFCFCFLIRFAVQQSGHFSAEPVRDASVLEQCRRVLPQVGGAQRDDIPGLPLHRPELYHSLVLRLGLLGQFG